MADKPRASPPIYLGLGSNLGDRRANLGEAVERVRALGLRVVEASSIYETEPVGLGGQPWFLNQVIEVTAEAGSRFEAGPESLLLELLKIENEMGRERTVRYGPRVIDIDLLLYGSLILDRPDANPAGVSIIVPHPRMHLRRFVLEPVCEIAPDVLHPLLGKSCRELLAGLEDPSRVTKVKDPGARIKDSGAGIFE